MMYTLMVTAKVNESDQHAQLTEAWRTSLHIRSNGSGTSALELPRRN